jgi:hypothetical protein
MRGIGSQALRKGVEMDARKRKNNSDRRIFFAIYMDAQKTRDAMLVLIIFLLFVVLHCSCFATNEHRGYTFPTLSCAGTYFYVYRALT